MSRPGAGGAGTISRNRGLRANGDAGACVNIVASGCSRRGRPPGVVTPVPVPVCPGGVAAPPPYHAPSAPVCGSPAAATMFVSCDTRIFLGQSFQFVNICLIPNGRGQIRPQEACPLGRLATSKTLPDQTLDRPWPLDESTPYKDVVLEREETVHRAVKRRHHGKDHYRPGAIRNTVQCPKTSQWSGPRQSARRSPA